MATYPHPVSVCIPAEDQVGQLHLERSAEAARPTPFKAVYWNVDGTEMSDHFELHTPWGAFFERENFDLVFMADTRALPFEGPNAYATIRLEQWRENSGGFIALVHERRAQYAKVHRYPEARALGISWGNRRFVVIAVYLPPNNREEIRAATERLQAIIHSFIRRDFRIIILGDWNSGSPVYPDGRRRPGDTACRELWENTGLRPLAPRPNVDFGLNNGRPFTFVRRRQGHATRTFIDHPLVDGGPGWQENLPSFDITYGLPVGNHFPISVETTLTTPATHPRIRKSFIHLKWISKNFARAKALRWRLRGVIRDTCQEIVDGEGSLVAKIDAIYLYLRAMDMIIGIHSGALEVCELRKMSARFRSPLSAEVNETARELFLLQAMDWGDVEEGEVDGLLHHYSDLVEREKAAMLENWARELEVCFDKHELAKLWKKITATHRTKYVFPDADGSINIDIAHQGDLNRAYWEELYTNNFEMNAEDSESLREMKETESTNDWDRPITNEEINALLKRKQPAAGGMDGLDLGFVLAIHEDNCDSLRIMFNLMLEANVIPFHGALQLHLAIPKAGKDPLKLGPTATRGLRSEVALLNLFSCITMDRASLAVEPVLDDSIGGARRKRGVRDQAAAVRLLCVWARYHRTPLFLSATDQRKAFDAIPPQVAEFFLIKYLGNGRTARVIATLLCQRDLCVYWQGVLQAPFQATRGIPQGNPNSPLLPNLILDSVPKVLAARDLGIMMYEKRITGVSYVDDVLLCALSIWVLWRMHNILEGWLNRFGQSFNPDKHEILLVVYAAYRHTQRLLQILRVLWPHAKIQPVLLRHLGVFYHGTNLNLTGHATRRRRAAFAAANVIKRNGALSEQPCPNTHRLMFVGLSRPTLVFSFDALSYNETIGRTFRRHQQTFLAHALALGRNTHFGQLCLFLGVPPINAWLTRAIMWFWTDGVTPSEARTEWRWRHNILWMEMRLLLEENWLVGGPPRRGILSHLLTAHVARQIEGINEADTLWQACADKLRSHEPDLVPPFEECNDEFGQRIRQIAIRLRVRVWENAQIQVITEALEHRAPVRMLIRHKWRLQLFLWNARAEALADGDLFANPPAPLTESNAPQGVAVGNQGNIALTKYPSLLEFAFPGGTSSLDLSYGAYKCGMSILFGCPQWRYTLPTEENEDDPRGEGKRCPMCNELIWTASGELEALESHSLYRCARIPRPPAALEFGQEFIDMRGHIDPLATANEREIVVGFSHREYWEMAELTYNLNPQAWAMRVARVDAEEEKEDG